MLNATYRYGGKSKAVPRDVCPIDYFMPDFPTNVRARLTEKSGLNHIYPDTNATMSIRAAILRKRVLSSP